MNTVEAAKHPIVNYAKERLWGSAQTTLPRHLESQFEVMDLADQRLVRAFFTAATTGCNVAISLAGDKKYGPSYQEKRNTSVNIWFSWLKENLPPHLSKEFGTPVELKQKTGGVSRFDAEWLPANRRYCITGPATYEGFVLPRLVIDMITWSDDQRLNVPEEVFAMLDQATKEPTVLRAIAKAANFQFERGVDPEQIRARLFDESITLELHPDYWFPILKRLNALLPAPLRKGLA